MSARPADPRVDEELGARSRVTQSAAPCSPAPPQPARKRRTQSAERAESLWGLRRTAPGTVARTRPTCFPMQARPAFVLNRFPSAVSVARRRDTDARIVERLTT